MTVPALEASRLMLRVGNDRSAKIVSSLCEAYPKEISGSQLMIRAGLPFHQSPVTAFVELCTSFHRINRVLPQYGWQAVRTGGTPGDRYVLAPVGV